MYLWQAIKDDAANHYFTFRILEHEYPDGLIICKRDEAKKHCEYASTLDDNE